VHEDYHRPGDSADKSDYQKDEKVAGIVYMTLWEVANRPTRPKVDRQLLSQLTQRGGWFLSERLRETSGSMSW